MGDYKYSKAYGESRSRGQQYASNILEGLGFKRKPASEDETEEERLKKSSNIQFKRLSDYINKKK